MELEAAVRALGALGEPTRLRLFRLLVEAGPPGLVVGQLVERLAVPPPTLSFHLRTLSHAGLVTQRREGTFIRYFARFDTMNGLIAYLGENCCGGHPERCRPEASPPSLTTETLPHA